MAATSSWVLSSFFNGVDETAPLIGPLTLMSGSSLTIASLGQ